MDSPVDPGLGGFLGIIGGDAEPDAPEPETPEAAQDSATAAEPDSPEGSSTDDLTAEELVAARLAAALEESGVEVPDPESADAAPDESEAAHPLLTQPDAEPSLDDLTPEQLRALAEEAIRLRGEVSTSSQANAMRKIAEASAAAVARVQTDYERMLAASAHHYQTFYRNELAKIAPTVTEEELPDRAAELAGRVWAARQEYETGQLEGTDDFVGYEALAKQAAHAAGMNTPEFRQIAAERLVKQAGLPEAAVAEVLKTQDTRQFEARVAELVGIRDALLAERNRNQAQLREEGRKRLLADTPRTAATGRPPGGKPPAYKGVIGEAVAIIRS